MKYLQKSFMVPVGQIRDPNHPKAADLDKLFPKKGVKRDVEEEPDEKEEEVSEDSSEN